MKKVFIILAVLFFPICALAAEKTNPNDLDGLNNALKLYFDGNIVESAKTFKRIADQFDPHNGNFNPLFDSFASFGWARCLEIGLHKFGLQGLIDRGMVDEKTVRLMAPTNEDFLNQISQIESWSESISSQAVYQKQLVPNDFENCEAALKNYSKYTCRLFLRDDGQVSVAVTKRPGFFGKLLDSMSGNSEK